MAEKKYILRYLPLFYEDLDSKTTYISEKLMNPQAANDLLDAVEKSIWERVSAPESFEKYYSHKERKYPYYRIYVGNYTVYYVVIDDEEAGKIMEVRRFLYNGQDSDSII